MKKVIIVLLVAVLVAGFAFADGTASEAKFTGSATIGYEYDLQSKNTGIFNEKGMKYNFTFTFNSANGESKGEGKLYAEIEATAKLELVAKNTKATGNLTPKATLKISKANIVGLNGDLIINILGPEGFYDYAQSYVVDGDDAPVYDYANDMTIDENGFVATYKDFSVAFAFYHWEIPELGQTELTNVYAGLQTPAFKLADGMTIQAGANFFYGKADLLGVEIGIMSVGGGFKFDYAPEDSKISAFFAADAAYDEGNLDDETEGTLPIDLSAGATYDFVTADVYFGTEDKFSTDYQSTLAARVTVDYDVNDQINVSAHAQTIWDDLNNDADKPILNFGGKLTYSADKFGAYAGVAVTMQDFGDGYELCPWTDPAGDDYAGLGIEAGVSTKALIDNATVALDYTRSDFAKAGDDPIDLGIIKASITVAF